MRETGANGHETVFMPRDRTSAVNKLAGLSSLAAKREWERAAMIALLVKPGRPGRKRLNVQPKGDEPYSIAEFARLGIYGFRSPEAISAYLKAWRISGLAAPEWGGRVELPTAEFPDVATIYNRPAADDSAEPIEPADDSDAEDYADDTEDVEDVPSHSGNGKPSGKAPRETTMLDQFLKVLDHADPANVVHGQSRDNINLLIKTLESWLDSLRDAAGDIAD